MHETCLTSNFTCIAKTGQTCFPPKEDATSERILVVEKTEWSCRPEKGSSAHWLPLFANANLSKRQAQPVGGSHALLMLTCWNVKLTPANLWHSWWCIWHDRKCTTFADSKCTKTTPCFQIPCDHAWFLLDLKEKLSIHLWRHLVTHQMMNPLCCHHCQADSKPWHATIANQFAMNPSAMTNAKFVLAGSFANMTTNLAAKTAML